MTAQRGRAAGGATLGLPATHTAGHLRGIARHDLSASLHRISVFEREHVGWLQVFAAATGPRAHMQATEAALIKMVRLTGNTVLATRRGWHGGAEERDEAPRLPRRGKRRPSNRLRPCRDAVRTEVLQSLEAPLMRKWVARLAASIRAAMDREIRE